MALDVGAHKGIWARHLAGEFREVYAFEPCYSNFQELLKVEDVTPINVALGDNNISLFLEAGKENTGQYHIAEDGQPVLIKRLDDLHLEDISFLKIDVEGYELHVLKGSDETIARDHPAILLEENGLCNRYGVTRDDIWDFLTERGYKEIKRWNKDYLFLAKSNLNTALYL